MIISPNSYIRRPPIGLEPKQIIVFNAIRYSVDICELTFERLETNLHQFSYGDFSEKHIPLIFSDVWTIINNINILKDVICQHFPESVNDKLIIDLKKFKDLRDSHQHLAERIFQTHSKLEISPIYGVLSWFAKENENSKEGIISTIYTGTILKDINARLENPTGKINNKKVNHIKFSGIKRVGKKTITFIDSTIYINEIIELIKKIIISYEIQIEKQLIGRDVSSRHLSDMVIEVKTIEINQI